MALTIPQLMGLGMPAPLATAIVGGDASLAVTDGSTTVASATQISFSGATVSSGGTGIADVAISGGAGVLQSTRTTLSSAQLLNLFTAPVTVVPTPGAGKFNLIITTVFNYTFVSTRYVSTGFGEGLYYSNDFAANGNAQQAYTIGSMPDSSGNPVFLGTASKLVVSQLGGGLNATVPAFGYPGTGGSIGPITGFSPANQAIVFGSEISNMTSGDGTGVITVYYIVVTL